MALNFIDITTSPFLPWGDVLEAVAECIELQIKPQLTGAKVYPYWIYEIDSASMLGKIVPAMRAETGTSQNKVHCWTIGIQSVTILKNQLGQPPMVGDQGRMNEWVILLDIWGLYEYEGVKESQNFFMDEVRLVAAGLSRNTDVFVSEIPKVSYAGRPEFSALQPIPFSDGSNYSVATGVMQINVSEALT